MTKPQKVFTREDMAVIAEQAAEKAVHRVFIALDINLTDSEDVIRARKDFNFLTGQRQGTENFKDRVKDGAYYGIGLFLLWITYVSWDVLKAGVKALWIN